MFTNKIVLSACIAFFAACVVSCSGSGSPTPAHENTHSDQHITSASTNSSADSLHPISASFDHWVQVDDLRMRLDFAAVDHPVLKHHGGEEFKGEESLILWYSVESLSNRDLDYQRPNDGVKAVDDKGRMIPYKTYRSLVIKGDAAFMKLTKASKEVADVMIFDRPNDDAQSIALTFPPLCIGTKGGFEFCIKTWEGKVKHSASVAPSPPVQAAPEGASIPVPPHSGEIKKSAVLQPSDAPAGVKPESGSSHAPVSMGSTGPKSVYVKGYTKKDGTYVAPHVRRSPSR